jgi:hypothetical protein
MILNQPLRAHYGFAIVAAKEFSELDTPAVSRDPA